MLYNKHECNEFLEAVRKRKYFVTDLELRECKSVNTIKTIKSTGDFDFTDFYPVENYTSYEIVIEYVFANHITISDVECIAFETTDTFDEVMAIYNKLEKLRLRKM